MSSFLTDDDDSINSYLALTNNGTVGGIAFVPGVCEDSLKRRAAALYLNSDLATGEVISQ